MADCSGRTVKWAIAEVLINHSTRDGRFYLQVDETETPVGKDKKADKFAGMGNQIGTPVLGLHGQKQLSRR
jgi:hypothetical protein